MNKVTQAERAALIAQATALLKAGYGQRAAEQALYEDGISKQRARHAVAKAMMRRNRPQR